MGSRLLLLYVGYSIGSYFFYSSYGGMGGYGYSFYSSYGFMGYGGMGGYNRMGYGDDFN